MNPWHIYTEIYGFIIYNLVKSKKALLPLNITQKIQQLKPKTAIYSLGIPCYIKLQVKI